jgi:hypothetical protein
VQIGIHGAYVGYQVVFRPYAEIMQHWMEVIVVGIQLLVLLSINAMMKPRYPKEMDTVLVGAAQCSTIACFCHAWRVLIGCATFPSDAHVIA